MKLSIRIIVMKNLNNKIRSLIMTPFVCLSLLTGGISPLYASALTVVDGGGTCTIYPVASYPNCHGGCGPCAAEGNYPARESSWVFTGQGTSGGCNPGYNAVVTSAVGEPLTAFRCEKNMDLDPFSAPLDAIGGPFHRNYNGVELNVPGDFAYAEDKYLAQSLELTSFIWGISEVGEKLCKPVGTSHPVSLVEWWKVIKDYVAAEKMRDALLRDRVTLMNEKMSALISDKEKNADLQLKAIQLQIESLNISLDSMTGSTLFSMDDKAGLVRATARIPQREKLLVAAAKSAEDNNRENSDNVKVYNACMQGVDSSIAVATNACARKKKVTECSTDAQGNETCVEREVPDPVPGSCEMAQSFLPMLKKGALKDMATLYLIVPIPSKQVNERLVRIGDYIDKQVNMYPKSNDSKYDWSTPIEKCTIPKMMVTIKNNGIICPADAPDSSYDKAKVEPLGASNDPIMQLGRYTLGVQMNQVEYEYGKRMYDDFKAKGMTDFEAEAALNDWVIKTERGKAFATDGTYDTAADRAYHDQLAKEYNKEVVPCTSTTCTGFKGERQPEPDYQLPPVTAVSDSAKSFLSTMGIYEPTLAEATKKFQDQWNLTDLYLGQPVDRVLYFQYVQGLINELIEVDKQKAKTLLERRAKLIVLYEETKKLMQAGQNNGSGSGNTPVYRPSLGSMNPGGQSAVAANQNASFSSGTATGSSTQTANRAVTTGDSQGSVTTNVGSASTGSSSSLGVGSNATGVSSSRRSSGSFTARNFAVSNAAKKKLDAIKKATDKNPVQYGHMTRAAGSNAIKNESSIVANLSKKMSENLGTGFVQKHGGSFSKAMDGLYNPDTAQSAISGIKKGTTTSTSESGSSYSRGGSYSSYGSGSSSNSRSYTTASSNNVRSGGQDGRAYNQMNHSSGPAEYRKIPKPDLFKKITNRYNSSRSRLGLEEVKEDEQ